MTESDAALRIDRWLFFARFFKSRSLATEAVTAGHARLNGERTSPGTRVRTGDVLDVQRGRVRQRVTVAAIPTRRGPASEAQSCYVEADADRDRRLALEEALKADRRSLPQTRGRPDKRTRRKLRDRSRGES